MEVREISKSRLKEIEAKLDETILHLNKLQKNVFHSQIIDNADFIQLMNISSSTAKNWRSKGVIAYSQVENKIYYKIEDIQILLNKHYRSFK